jgi:hypothetical protein
MASNADAVLAAVKAVVDGLNIVISPGNPLVVKVRKRPEYRSGDATAVCTVSGREIGREDNTADDTYKYIVRYEVLVTIVAKNSSLTAPNVDVQDWRGQINREVLEPGNLSAQLALISHADAKNKPWLATGSLDKNYDYASSAFDVYTLEPL